MMANYDILFKAYDIRGIYPKELDTKFAQLLAKAFVQHTNASEIAIGYDGRSSSKRLFEALVKGITAQGANVMDLGLCSTPMSYFAMIEGKYDAGIMITASHNPPNYNGFKLMGKLGRPIHSGNGAQDILELVKQGEFEKAKKKGKVKKKNWSKDYTKFLRKFFLDKKKIKRNLKEFKLVIDQSNGSGIVEVELLKKFFPNVKVINGRVSGNFPGHEPDPMKPQNRKQLVKEVKKTKAAMGIIFDGDADRVCFVDEKGNFVRPDILLSAMLDDIKKGKVIYDPRSSKYVKEKCSKRGLQAILSKAGRTNMTEVMRSEQAEIAGEGSGHYFFKEFKYLDCAGLAAVKILNWFLKKKDLKLSEIVQENDPYFHSGEMNFKVKNQSKAFLIMEQAFADASSVLFIDGMSAYYADYWFNIRKSNTEPVIRINAEANTKEKLDEITKKLNKIIDMIK